MKFEDIKIGQKYMVLKKDLENKSIQPCFPQYDNYCLRNNDIITVLGLHSKVPIFNRTSFQYFTKAAMFHFCEEQAKDYINNGTWIPAEWLVPLGNAY